MDLISSSASDEQTVWVAGDGPAVVLLHGGWAGAHAHWSSVWDALAEGHRVIAPELPRIVREEEGWTDYDEYAKWLDQLLGARRIEQAVIVGNSFGATLAYLVAVRYPHRCRGLVMVDGFPPPELPGAIRYLMRFGPLRSRALAHMRRHIYGPRALASGFDDARKAPAEIRHALEQPDDRRIQHMLDIVLSSRRVAETPGKPIMIVWGARDRLPNAGLAVGRRLHRSLPGSRLEVIEAAGHLPQVEQPERFVGVLRDFLSSLP